MTTETFNLEDLYATDEQIQENFDRLKRNVKAQRAFPIAYRKEQLRQLGKIINNEKDALCQALTKDLHKAYSESIMTELLPINDELLLFEARLDEWSKPEYVSKSLLFAMDDVHIVPEFV